MKVTARIAVFAVLSLLSIPFSLTTYADPNGSGVIYGNDDRKNLYEIMNPSYRRLSDSTVALVDAANFSQDSSGLLKLKESTLMAVTGVCGSERFANEPSTAFCSGSLIGKNIVLTAGHCIADQDSCNKTKMIFGFDVNSAGEYPKEVKESETYHCKSIIYRQRDDTGADFGIIELDRDVTGHVPLKLANRTHSTIPVGTKLLLIGHPLGLPTKLDDGGRVRAADSNGFFVATTDSYGGNSGSPVFNQRSEKIEGVLVRGDDDFVLKGRCYVSKVCTETACRGEDVTKVSSITPFVPPQDL